MRYSAWEINIINDKKAVAFRRMPPDDEEVVVHLQSSEGPCKWQGWWPYPPSNMEDPTIVTGICLWDARWQVEFEQPNKKGESKLANRSPALPVDRAKIYDYLAKGHRIKRILIPGGLGEYHRWLLDWQAWVIQEIQPSRILYHLPRLEYHKYIQDLEKGLGIQISDLHDKLNNFANQIQETIQKRFPQTVEVEFIEPLTMGATTPEESYLWPYLYPEAFKVNPKKSIGVEDLAEQRLSFEAWRLRRLRGELIDPTPVLCGVLDIPHPYMVKDLSGRKVEVIELW